MASLADTLWHEFAVETEDHLLAVEPLLARGDPERTGTEEISQLFRSFHSIKGISRAMEVLGMEAVAHHAENLLGLVRDGRVSLDARLADLLLQAVDALKQMRGRMIADREDTAPDPALLARLGAAYAELGGDGDGATTEPPPEPIAAESDGASLHEDPEMLGIFVEMVKQRGAELCAALAASAEARETAADAADMLAHAAGVMGFDALAESVGRILETLRAAEPGALADEARQTLAGCLGDIRLQIELIGEITGQNAGAAEFAAALAVATAADQTHLAARLGEALAQLRADLDVEDWAAAEAAAIPVAALAKQLQAALAARALTRLPQLLLLVDDLYSRAALGEVALSDAVLDATEDLLARIDVGPDAAVEDCSEEDAAALAAQLRADLTDQISGDEPASRIVSGIYLPAELASVLSAETLAVFEQGVADGLVPYALLLFLEDEPAIAERLIGWLTGEARTVANRTVLTGSESWFEFLALSARSPAEFATALLAIDPARQCLRGLRRLTDAPLGQPLLDAAEPAAVPAAEPAPAARRATSAANVIRVRSEAIDIFLDEIGEMRAAVGALSHAARGGSGVAALARSRQLAARLPAETRDEFAGVLRTLAEREHALLDAEERLSGIVGRVHQSALDFRVVPIDVVFNRYPRIVRDQAARQGKLVELLLEGRDVRIDKSMVEALADPLLHMVRNAVDHGIEPPDERRAAGKPERARLTLRASQRGAEIEIKIADDGRGLDAAAIRAKAINRGLVTPARAATLDDPEIFRFIFEAGLSTAAAITETSGRGVGMDVVLTTVRRLSGDIAIRSARGQGTVFTLTLPVSAALQNALIVRVGDQSLAIPERYVAAVMNIAADAVHRIGVQRSIVYRQAVVPIYDLGALLGMAEPVASHADRPTIIASNGRNLIGLEVAAVEHRQELFLKDLHPLLAQFPGVGGASVLNDGRVVLVLDGDELMQLAARGVEAAEPAEERIAS
jgi:two-component system, chemotaxis family, sensor kinase CheA